MYMYSTCIYKLRASSVHSAGVEVLLAQQGMGDDNNVVSAPIVQSMQNYSHNTRTECELYTQYSGHIITSTMMHSDRSARKTYLYIRTMYMYM